MSSFSTFRPAQGSSKTLFRAPSLHAHPQSLGSSSSSSLPPPLPPPAPMHIEPATKRARLSERLNLARTTESALPFDFDEANFDPTSFLEETLSSSTMHKIDIEETMAEPEPSARAAVDQERYIQACFDAPPLDWSIKTKARFTSPVSFEWCSNVSAWDECDAIDDFTSTSSSSHNHHHQQHQRSFAQACLYWCYPADAMTARHPVMVSFRDAQGKATELQTLQDTLCLAFMKKRWAEWEMSFRSLYFRLRNQQCPHFYYQTSTFSILFLAGDKSSSIAPAAIISKSTKGFRLWLTKKGIHFSMPLEHSNSEMSSNRSGENKNNEPEHTTSSLLLVSGAQDLHALYDTLINHDQRKDDVPILYAPSSFLHATMKSIQVLRTSQSSRAVSASSSDSSRHVYSLELVGPMLPFAINKLCSLFKQSQGQFSGRFWSDLATINFNAVTSVPQLRHLSPYESIPVYTLDEVVALLSESVMEKASKTTVPIARVKFEDGTFWISFSS